MRKLLLVIFAAFAVCFAGCKKENQQNPSIADTSAKQMQPSDDQSASNEDQSTANPDQSNGQNGVQDQTGVQNDQSSTEAGASGQIPSSNDLTNQQPNADNNNLAQPTAPTGATPDTVQGSTQLDESKDSQAQVPSLPQDSNTDNQTPNNMVNPASN
jgi:hypothetical protein